MSSKLAEQTLDHLEQSYCLTHDREMEENVTEKMEEEEKFEEKVEEGKKFEEEMEEEENVTEKMEEEENVTEKMEEEENVTEKMEEEENVEEKVEEEEKFEKEKVEEKVEENIEKLVEETEEKVEKQAQKKENKEGGFWERSSHPFLEQLEKFVLKELEDRKFSNSADFSDYIQSNYGREIVMIILASSYDVSFVGEVELSVVGKSCVIKRDLHRGVESRTTTKRWRLLLLNTYYKDYKEPHQSFLLIDRNSLIIEEFDPLGSIAENEVCESVLTKWCGENYPDYYFVTCSSYCPEAGPQEDGTCWLLCVLWLLVRLTTEDWHRQDIITHLLYLKATKKLDQLLMRCGHWIVNSLKSIDFLHHRDEYNEYCGVHEIFKKRYSDSKDYVMVRKLNAHHKKIFGAYERGDFKQMKQLISDGWEDVA